MVAAAGCSLTTDLTGFSASDAGEQPDAGAPSREAGADGDAVAAFRFACDLTIRNVAATSLPKDHAVCFQAGATEVAVARAAGKVRADFGDARILGPSGERPRALDQRSTGALAICFRLERPIAPGASDRGYSLVYGAEMLAPPAVADEAVFDFFDGFEGTSLSARWLVHGTVAVGGGVATLRQMGNEPGITTPASTDDVPADASLEIRARVTNPTSRGLDVSASQSIFYWLGFQKRGDFETGEPYSIFYGTPGRIEARHEMAGGECTGIICGDSSSAQSNAFRVYRIDRRAEGARFTYDDETRFEAKGSSGDMSIMIRGWLRESDIEVDWVRARPLVWPEPELVIDAERRTGL